MSFPSNEPSEPCLRDERTRVPLIAVAGCYFAPVTSSTAARQRQANEALKQPSRIVVVGASAGGVEAFKVLARGLPADFPAALLLVLHIPPHGPSLLAGILDRCGPLPAVEASDGAPLEAGHIYVAVPDRHLLVDGEVIRLSRGPRENRFRPAIDALFRSAAYTRGPRVVGVVLTGQLDDGTSGLWAVKDRGGVAIVQSPRDAQFPSMPMSALQHVDVDHMVGLDTLPDVLTQLAHRPLPSAALQGASSMRIENDIAAGADPLQAGSLQLGKSSSMTCPECLGVLSKLEEGPLVRFRCHTGHAYSMQALLADIDDSIDGSLWRVLKTLHERSILLREAAELSRQRNDFAEAQSLESRAHECDERGQTIRKMLQDSAATDHDRGASLDAGVR